MKKILTENIANPNTKLPLVGSGLVHLQQGYRELAAAVAKSLIFDSSLATILYGCENTVAGPSNSISAGAIYYELNFPAWVSGAYAAGAFVTRSSKCYIAMQTVTSEDPATAPTFWAFIGDQGEGNIFLVDAVVVNPLADTLVVKPVLTFDAIDPIQFTDGQSFSVHATVKMAVVDSTTGSGISNFSALIGGWHVVGASGEPAFQNSWNFNAYPARFKKDANKCVRLGGRVDSGTTATVVFTLPAGYRPLTLMKFTIGTNTVDVAQCSVDTTGDVTVFFSGGSVRYLDGVTIPLD